MIPAVSDLEARTLGKVRWRLIPFLFLLYVIAYLDRVNVGYAALDMNRDLGFSAAIYGFGSGIFFLSYTRATGSSAWPSSPTRPTQAMRRPPSTTAARHTSENNVWMSWLRTMSELMRLAAA